jgi:hypothetical protein
MIKEAMNFHKPAHLWGRLVVSVTATERCPGLYIGGHTPTTNAVYPARQLVRDVISATYTMRKAHAFPIFKPTSEGQRAKVLQLVVVHADETRR